MAAKLDIPFKIPRNTDEKREISPVQSDVFAMSIYPALYLSPQNLNVGNVNSPFVMFAYDLNLRQK